MDKNYKVGSIRQIVRQLHQNGYSISEYALRRWVQDGTVPSVRSGCKRFVAYSHVIDYLTAGNLPAEKQTACN